jgi:hypothetical protein
MTRALVIRHSFVIRHLEFVIRRNRFLSVWSAEKEGGHLRGAAGGLGGSADRKTRREDGWEKDGLGLGIRRRLRDGRGSGGRGKPPSTISEAPGGWGDRPEPSGETGPARMPAPSCHFGVVGLLLSKACAKPRSGKPQFATTAGEARVKSQKSVLRGEDSSSSFLVTMTFFRVTPSRQGLKD